MWLLALPSLLLQIPTTTTLHKNTKFYCSSYPVQRFLYVKAGATGNWCGLGHVFSPDYFILISCKSTLLRGGLSFSFRFSWMITDKGFVVNCDQDIYMGASGHVKKKV